MPKISKIIMSKVSQCIHEFPNETFKSDGQNSLCVACEKPVLITQYSFLYGEGRESIKYSLSKINIFYMLSIWLSSCDRDNHGRTPHCRFSHSYCKQIIFFVSSERALFKEMYPDLTLPPEPIITRWST